jgi:hypothetical protein
MNKKSFITIVSFLLMFSFMNVYGSASKLGTAGAVELTIPMGAKSIGMAGANIAAVYGTEAIYWNPAGVASFESVEASFSYTSYFADMNISYLTLVVGMGEFGNIGISIQALDIGNIEVTTIDNPEGDGSVLTPSYMNVGLTYAKKLTDAISFGSNVKYVTEQLGSMKANAIVFDFGLQYRTKYNIDFGLSLKNIGSKLQYSGSEIEFDSSIPNANPNATTRKTKLDMASHEMPTSFNMGLVYNYDVNKENALDFAGQYSVNSYDIDKFLFGAEYTWRGMVSLRAGYEMPLFPSDYEQKYKDDYQYGLTFGAGVNVSVGGSTLRIDYAYRDMKLFSPVNYFTLGFVF